MNNKCGGLYNSSLKEMVGVESFVYPVTKSLFKVWVGQETMPQLHPLLLAAGAKQWDPCLIRQVSFPGNGMWKK